MKPFWQSKTLWLNVVALAIIGMQVAGTADIGLSPATQTALLAVANVLLRLLTNQGVQMGPSKESDMNWGWLKLVGQIAPIALAATPMAPLAPYIAIGVQQAEQMEGATGAQKLAKAVEIAKTGIAAADAQAGRQIIDPAAADAAITAGVNAVVGTVNIIHDFHKDAGVTDKPQGL